MADNTSATGGYLAPINTEAQDTAFEDFFHGVLSGISGITGVLTRPAWQQNPPPVPEPDIDWLAFSITTDEAAAGSAYFVPDTITEGEVESEVVNAWRDETITLKVSAYGPNAQATAKRVREGLQIGQNRETLRASGVSFLTASDIRHVPELVNERWHNRADIDLEFNRQTRRTYRILSLIKAAGTINGNEFETETP